MLLERTLCQLDVGYVPPERAREMGSLGYVQWLGSLRSRDDFVAEARRAFDLSIPFAPSSPAVAVFCHLLATSMDTPLTPLPLHLPEKVRRGGARARRLTF